MVNLPSRNVIICLTILVLVLSLVPLGGDKYWTKLVTRMMVLGIFAMSLDLLVGYTGLVSFGHAAFFGLSGYILHLISPEDEAANLLWILPLCLGGTALAAAIIGGLSVRTKGIYFIMVTLAFAQMLFYFFHDSDLAGGSDGAFIYIKPVLNIGSWVLLDLGNRNTLFYSRMVSMVAIYVSLVILLRSSFGKAIQGIKINEHRMQALGYNTYVYKLVSFVIAGTIAGFAGFMFASIDGFVSPELLGWQESGIALVIVILGGMGTLFGSILGAIALLGVEELFRDKALFGVMSSHWQILMGSFVIFVVLFFKNGLAGVFLRFAGSREGER